MAPSTTKGGTIEVDSGQVTLAGGGSSSGGTFNVAAGAMLDVTGGQSPSWSGTFNGTGAGQVVLASGALYASGGVLLNMASNLFQWTGGRLNSGNWTNINMMTISGGTSVRGGTFYNNGLVKMIGAGSLNLPTDFASGGSFFENLSTGTDYRVRRKQHGIPHRRISPGGFDNFGTVWMTGSGTSTISSPFNNQGGTIEVDSGQVTLAGGGSSSGGTFNVAAGAVLDLTGSSSTPIWSGTITSTGAGLVQMDYCIQPNNLTLNFTGTPFLWTGTFVNGGVVTNLGKVTVEGSQLNNSIYFYNLGLVKTTNGAGLSMSWPNGETAHFENLAQGTYQITGDGGITGLNSTAFDNWGLVRKSGGTGNSVIGVPFSSQGGTVEVDSGQVTLSGGGSSSGGTFNVAAGAVLDLTGIVETGPHGRD